MDLNRTVEVLRAVGTFISQDKKDLSLRGLQATVEPKSNLDFYTVGSGSLHCEFSGFILSLIYELCLLIVK